MVTGYCMSSVNGINMYAHRASYFMFVGNLKKGCVINHICEIKNCVNFHHLEQIPQSQNIRYSKQKRPLPPSIIKKNQKHLLDILQQYTKETKRLSKPHIDLKLIIKDGKNKFSLQTFQAAIKLKLFTIGINTYSNRYVQALRYLDKILDQTDLDIEELGEELGLKPTKTKMRKKLDGVLA